MTPVGNSYQSSELKNTLRVLLILVGDEGLGHVPQPRKYILENMFSEVHFPANCHWQFSPPTLVGVSSPSHK